MFTKVLVANRGEIACRIMRTLDALGIKSVAIYSEADAEAPHVSMADEAYCIGPAPVSESYLQSDKIIKLVKTTGANAIHPGYGLLSENVDFAKACETNGIDFIGSRPEQIREFGLKHEARRIAEESKVPLLPGSGLLNSIEDAMSKAEVIGYPIMLKSTAGGGGIGMQNCTNAQELQDAYEKVERLSKSHFGQGGIFLEKFVANARHLEVQIFGDGKGHVLSLGVRDCSAQRRNQKVIEETPPPNVADSILKEIQNAAVRLAESVQYRSAGTVEFIYDNDSATFYFLEVNTRLQVEHGVTELVTGVDLVKWMVELASGNMTQLPPAEEIAITGHAIQARIYAEDANKDFQPSSGLLTNVEFPEGLRCDHWVQSGSEISPYYDPLLAKLQVHAKDRDSAVVALQLALNATRLDGIETNLHYLKSIVKAESFTEGQLVTKSLASHSYQPNSIEVLRSGTMTTIQDFPGRTGYWEVGVPPSGPMDNLSFRLGNRLLGNGASAAGMEITATGPKIRFNNRCHFVITGADMSAKLDDAPIENYKRYQAKTGSILDIVKAQEAGVRCYLCVSGGFDVPEYLGSRSTFTLGQFGGHGGRALRVGDVIHYAASAENGKLPSVDTLPTNAQPQLCNTWDIGVLYGPHGAPDFFTNEDIEVFFSTKWEVHYNSARTGVRLIGPKPKWARTDGGEAGLHPSNIHDTAYAIGAIDFTGDMPVILGPDGPSLGGFVCPATIIEAERWKMGQLKPGDTIRFRCVTREQAMLITEEQNALIDSLKPVSLKLAGSRVPCSRELVLHNSGEGADKLVIRQAGDAYVLAEVGPMALDFKLRFHIHVLYEALKSDLPDYVEDITPGIRSLQVHIDPTKSDTETAAAWIAKANAALPPLKNITVPSRTIHMPLSWDDPSTQLATQKYMQSVRADAPWCPDNIEFIRRINGLETRQDVYDIVFNARYVVLGLGDVYLGAPVATPLDPRHRLVTTKYNPARTWTPENAVGIGGAYLCIYGMEGPGGYQFVGRTIQVWNRYRTTQSFEDGKPWLLRFFDQICYYPVSESELEQLRVDFPQGRFNPKVEEGEFSLADYEQFLLDNEQSISAFKEKQQASFEAERQRWKAAGIAAYIDEETDATDSPAEALPDGVEPVESPVAGSAWKVLITEPDEVVEAGQTLAILESMKMEIAVEAPISGKVTQVLCKSSQAVAPGQTLFGITP